MGSLYLADEGVHYYRRSLMRVSHRALYLICGSNGIHPDTVLHTLSAEVGSRKVTVDFGSGSTHTYSDSRIPILSPVRPHVTASEYTTSIL